MPTMRTTTELTLTFGERLAKARRLAGLTQTELADKLGIGRRSISRYEDDTVPPNRAICIAWSVITEVPVWWLLGDNDGEGNTGSVTPGYLWSDHPELPLFADAA